MIHTSLMSLPVSVTLLSTVKRQFMCTTVQTNRWQRLLRPQEHLKESFVTIFSFVSRWSVRAPHTFYCVCRCKFWTKNNTDFINKFEILKCLVRFPLVFNQNTSTYIPVLMIRWRRLSVCSQAENLKDRKHQRCCLSLSTFINTC